MGRPAGRHTSDVGGLRPERAAADEDALRARALQLGRSGEPLPRPDTWVGYLLERASVEFWQAGPDRMHRRLRYERDGIGGSNDRLKS